MKIYQNETTGEIVLYLSGDNNASCCCGSALRVMEAGTSDGAQEKHVPVFTVRDGIVHVRVGEVAHPMAEDHWIEWVLLETDKGFSVRTLSPTGTPEALFALAPEEHVRAVYALCNLHKLWKAEA